MREIPEEVLYDTRLVERHIAKGYITREQYNEHLEKVGDASDLGEVIDLGEMSADSPLQSEPEAAPPPEKAEP